MRTCWTIDRGNSHPHVGKFEAGQLIGVYPLNDREHFRPSSQDEAIIANVGQGELELPKFKKISDVKNFRRGDHFLDMPVHYSESLGADRLAVAYYVWKKTAKHPTLIIDAGTFLTADIVSASGFQGGLILPGPQTMLASYARGARLPQVKISENHFSPTSLPRNTEEAIASAVAAAMAGAISSIATLGKPCSLVLTGGQADTVLPLIKQLKLETNSDPHLIHHALYLIHNALQA
jgi:type III pantothenate kinase